MKNFGPSCCETRTLLLQKQRMNVEDLEDQLILFTADGDEYHAAQVVGELEEAKSLARLIHKCRG